jgi:hypothetical protein
MPAGGWDATANAGVGSGNDRRRQHGLPIIIQGKAGQAIAIIGDDDEQALHPFGIVSQ